MEDKLQEYRDWLIKEIEQAKDEAYEEAGHNAYFGNGFDAGVKFALEYQKATNYRLIEKWENETHERNENLTQLDKEIYVTVDKYDLLELQTKVLYEITKRDSAIQFVIDLKKIGETVND